MPGRAAEAHGLRAGSRSAPRQGVRARRRRPERIDPRELARHLACPSCAAPMDVHPYYGPGNIVIDTCSRCDFVWLDAGELQQIADAPGRDRGRPRRLPLVDALEDED